MLNKAQKELLDRLVKSLSEEQINWLSGYFAGLTVKPEKVELPWAKGLDNAPEGASLHILFGSRSGNAESVARQLRSAVSSAGIQVRLTDLNDYNPENIQQETNIVLVVSTYGDGNPPASAQSFYDYLFSGKITSLHLNYSVCALGDSSYERFCQAGFDFDNRLHALGARRILERTEFDIDYEDRAGAWFKQVVQAFNYMSGAQDKVHVKTSGDEDVRGGATTRFSKKNPFPARILSRELLNGKGSNREVYHFRLSIAGSDLTYEPGDALGIVPRNSPKLVEAVIRENDFIPGQIVENGVGAGSIDEILLNHYELTTLSKDVLLKYAGLSNSNKLREIITNSDSLGKYIRQRDILDMIRDFPAQYAPEEFLHVLRRLQPRLYSIASSPFEHPDEVHLTIRAISNEAFGRRRDGVCSGFMADSLQAGDTVPVFIDRNPVFKLPEDPAIPVIMIGPGTGIAPFRGFMQQRLHQAKKSENWLFFGAQHQKTDFYYRKEWEFFRRKGILTRFDSAFSRDTEQRIYVQHRMLEESKAFYSWIDSGAHLYVCGDMHRMASDVFKTVCQIVSREGNMSADEARIYVRQMQKSGRYQEDVY